MYIHQPDAMNYRQHPHRAKARATAFKEQDSEKDPEADKKSCYALRRIIKQANRQYRTKIES